jgi:hypothetical protein
MQTLLLVTAPLIYIFIMVFSAWIGILSGKTHGRQRRGINPQPVIAILAGLAACPLVAILIQLGRLSIPAAELTFVLLCFTLGIGFVVGLIYIWSANIVLDNMATTSLFVLGTIGGSAICLYFYFFHKEVQEILISTAWGFLF